MGVWMSMPKDNRRQLFVEDGATRDEAYSVDIAIVEIAGKYVDGMSATSQPSVDGERLLIGRRLASIFDGTLDDALIEVDRHLLSETEHRAEFVQWIDGADAADLVKDVFRTVHVPTIERGQPDYVLVMTSLKRERSVIVALYAL